MTPLEIIAAAKEAAVKATDAYLAEGHHWFPCGFAWVIIRPARGPVVNALRASGDGSKAHGGGFQVWNPSKNHTQSMEALYAGAKAYAEVLKANGIDAYADNRMD